MTDQLLAGVNPATIVKLGTIGGLARKAYRGAPMELLDTAAITEAAGITGDHRGVRKGAGKRQITLIERGRWNEACASVDVALPWWARRCNVVVDGFELPQTVGVRLRLGRDVVLETTRYTDPCERMEALAPGLFDALWLDWRAGMCTRVIQGGAVQVRDVIRLDL